MVFYRKYRPQTIHDLDLASVREKLYSILSGKSLPHAFLFTGPKGLGKTSSARILAKAINCEERHKSEVLSSKKEKSKKLTTDDVQPTTSLEPCNECSACISITNGSNIDVLEIDAASNRGIDEIRELRERIKFAPSSLEKKVYIIDEVHMLTTEAFNALLKTLEEPPSHVVFILATTEAWKLPSTIVSRTFHVMFEKPSKDEQIRSLSRIVTGEKLDIEEGVLEKVITLADGAFRDGAKILEELAFEAKDGKITKAILEKTHKTDSIELQVKELLKSLAQKDAKSSLATIESLSQNGCDFKVVIEKSVEELRMILLSKSGIEKESLDLTLETSSVETLLEYLNQAYKDLRFSVLPQLPLELAVVKYCIIDEENEKLKMKNVNQTFHPQNLAVKETPQIIQPSSNGAVKQSDNISPFMNGSSQDNLLRQLIDQIKKENISIAGVLRSCKVVESGNGLEIVAPYKFHADKLQETKSFHLLETTVATILGKSVKIHIAIQSK